MNSSRHIRDALVIICLSTRAWKRKNDLSSYPKLKSNNLLHEALYNMALDEMVNAVEPDTTLRTGKEWSGVWTAM